MENKLLSAALQWAKIIPIFPCKPNAKQPDCPHGFLDATQDEAVIRRWWTEEPNRNIAACPDHAHCWVLDVDGEEGKKSLEQLEAQYAQLPRTIRVRTPSGGLHIWFCGSRPSGVRIMPGLDTRGIGGYVLLPPSIVNGREYAFILD